MIKEDELFAIQSNIIGHLLKNAEDIDKLSINEDYLKDFGTCSFKYIFKRIRQIHKEGRDAELLTDLLSDKLINQDFLFKAVEGNPYEKMASIRGLEDVVINAYKDRLLREEFKNYADETRSIEDYTKRINEINELGTVKQENITVEDLKACLESDKRDIKGLGFPKLEAFLKMKEHDFMVISASGTGGGKTALALNMLSELSKHYQCIYFNMEMGEEDIKERLISIESGVPMQTLEQYRYITDKALKKRIDEAMIEIGAHKKITLLTGAKSLEAIKGTVNRLDSDEHVIVFVDHIGMIRGFSRASLYERTTEIAKSLRAIALNHNVTMIALSQVSRGQPQQGQKAKLNEPPTLSRLKESGEIENSARQVVFIYNKQEDDYYLRIAKNTRGSVDVDIPIDFTKKIMTIREK